MDNQKDSKLKTGTRGLSEEFMKELLEGRLQGLLKAVRADDTLCMEIRDNYVNIYYRGGNLCKITPNNGYTFYFNKKYSRTSTDEMFVNKMKKASPDEWVDCFPQLKAMMDKWFSANPKEEREFQQQIARENNCSCISNDTDYFIIDLEYTSSESNGRFDMVAVKWPSTSHNRRKNENLKLSVIEVKYGDGAIAGKSGIAKHFRDWKEFFSDKEKLMSFKDEMEKVFNQKIKLGLVRNFDKEIKSLSDERPELIFLLANHKPASSKWHNELAEILNTDKTAFEDANTMIAGASMLGYGLYSSCMISVSDYISRNIH